MVISRSDALKYRTSCLPDFRCTITRQIFTFWHKNSMLLMSNMTVGKRKLLWCLFSYLKGKGLDEWDATDVSKLVTGMNWCSDVIPHFPPIVYSLLFVTSYNSLIGTNLIWTAVLAQYLFVQNCVEEVASHIFLLRYRMKRLKTCN